MKICGKCTNSLTGKSPGLQCGGACKQFFHANNRCSDVTKNQLSLINNLPGGNWLCVKCRSMRDITDLPVESDGEDIDGDRTEVAGIENLTKIIADLNRNVRELRTSVEFCSGKITDFEKKLSKLDDTIKLTNQLKKENESMKKEISDLNHRMNKLEQHSRENNIEIMDVPEKKKENLFEIMTKIISYVNHEVRPEGLDFITRVPTKLTNKPKNIVVKFRSKIEKQNFLAAVKLKRTEQGGKQGFKIDNVSPRCFINEHLTTVNKILYKSAREAAHNNNFKYVWVQNGNILARKDDTSKILHIMSESDLKMITK
ncbi:uncharacterized protein LOC123323120 [Coccinella septempunctata]|uniref:uncharacterized protein LOC123323120 n=1 Tax=Coccinella septempunctata TaxID=41139 RepID=UPI001D07ABA7|nr:uncharacterized protein LOC123323120 [Coccinella septempunctata]